MKITTQNFAAKSATKQLENVLNNMREYKNVYLAGDKLQFINELEGESNYEKRSKFIP